MKLKIGVGGLLCLFLGCFSPVYAADFSVTLKPDYNGNGLVVGGRMPELGLLPILNYKDRAVKLSAFKDKLLVLDFWATTCGSCLEAMPSIAALQTRFNGRLQVIDVDYEKAGYVAAYLAKHPAKRALGLPVIGSDVLLKKLFPYQYLPHIVWIRNGIFIGATDGDYLDAANIEKVLADPHFTFDPGNPAVVPDYRRPLFAVSGGSGHTAGSIMSSSVFAPAIPGVPLKAGWDTTGGNTRFYAVNHPLLNLFAMALNSGLPFLANRRVLEVHDSSLILNLRHDYEDQWAAAHSYCTEIVVPGEVNARGRVRELLLSQIKASVGLIGVIAKREMDCLSLDIPAAIVGSKQPAASLHSAYPVKEISIEAGKPVILHHIHLDDLAWLMNRQEGMPPVLIESGKDASFAFDLDLPEVPQNINAWKRVLATRGIELKSCKRKLDMFVLSDAGGRDSP